MCTIDLLSFYALTSWSSFCKSLDLDRWPLQLGVVDISWCHKIENRQAGIGITFRAVLHGHRQVPLLAFTRKRHVRHSDPHDTTQDSSRAEPVAARFFRLQWQSRGPAALAAACAPLFSSTNCGVVAVGWCHRCSASRVFVGAAPNNRSRRSCCLLAPAQ